MNCFACISPRRREFQKAVRRLEGNAGARSISRLVDSLDHQDGEKPYTGGAHSFTLKQLAAATKNFGEENLIGEGGFGKVYRGFLASGEMVAIKQLNKLGLQGNQEFLVEVLMLIMLRHPHLVTLIGYCAEREERLLVYEFMPHGSLDDHLFDLPAYKDGLDWNLRINIALGAAKGLAYLHDVAKPPVIYRDLKCANILLDKNFNPKLSDFGLAKLGPTGDRSHVTTRVMGTYGYCDPDYAVTGKLSVKSDVYSFGVVLLELLTGRKAIDFTRERGEQSLIAWARPFLHDKRRVSRLADPKLHGRFPLLALYRLARIIVDCLDENQSFRPSMRNVVACLEVVQSKPYVPGPGGGSMTPEAKPRVSPLWPANTRAVNEEEDKSNRGYSY